jgi:hypothetical protein
MGHLRPMFLLMVGLGHGTFFVVDIWRTAVVLSQERRDRGRPQGIAPTRWKTVGCFRESIAGWLVKVKVFWVWFAWLRSPGRSEGDRVFLVMVL